MKYLHRYIYMYKKSKQTLQNRSLCYINHRQQFILTLIIIEMSRISVFGIKRAFHIF